MMMAHALRIRERTKAEVVASLPKDLFLNAGPNETLSTVPAYARRIAGFGLVGQPGEPGGAGPSA
jgi:hypothetical protein